MTDDPTFEEVMEHLRVSRFQGVHDCALGSLWDFFCEAEKQIPAGTRVTEDVRQALCAGAEAYARDHYPKTIAVICNAICLKN